MMKKVTIKLEKDDVALVFTGNDVNLYLPQAKGDEPLSGTALTAIAIANLISKGDKKFTNLLIKAIDRITKQIKEADGS